MACTGTGNATDLLIKQLEKVSEMDSEPAYRIGIIEALGKLHDEKAVDPLIRALENKNFQIRIAALYSLGILGGEKVEETLITKLDKLSDPDKAHSEFQKHIILNLGNIKSRKVAHMLIHKLEDKNPEIRKCAAEFLGEIKDKQAID